MYTRIVLKRRSKCPITTLKEIHYYPKFSLTLLAYVWCVVLSLEDPGDELEAAREELEVGIFDGI